MKARLQKIGLVALSCVLALLALCALLLMLGARINTTRSVPLGLYWRVDAPVVKGAFVIICPPPDAVFKEVRERGYIASGQCPGNFGYLMKRVAAVPGDLVNVALDGVYVNGQRLAHSAPLVRDGAGRPLPRYAPGPHVLDETQLLLMGDINPKSFDGRYFGPLRRTQIQDVIVPVFIWDGMSGGSQGGK